MSSKTFGVVVGVVIALAVAMFGGLYMLGLYAQGNAGFNERYGDEFQYQNLEPDTYDLEEDTLYFEDGDTFQEDANFNFDDKTPTNEDIQFLE
jgi:hypothetical protein